MFFDDSHDGKQFKICGYRPDKQPSKYGSVLYAQGNCMLYIM